ncbi:MAG: sel1 repeat family protein [Roseomonas sp.]|nr:sel1 repeat family protein [Roseomonas sp.]
MEKYIILIFGLLAGSAYGSQEEAFRAGQDAFFQGNHVVARERFEEAAQLGFVPAQSALCNMYRLGQGGSQIFGRALNLCLEAANKDDAPAQWILGIMHERGQGVPMDFSRAAFWYRRAAEQGDGFAQHDLARLYELGRGVGEDPIEAYKWYNVSAANNRLLRVMPSASAHNRDRLAQRMTPEQIATAQARASAWRPNAPAVSQDAFALPDPTAPRR